MKRSNPESSKRNMETGFFYKPKLQRIEPSISVTALATIPVIPFSASLFETDEIKDPWSQCYSARAVWEALENPVKTVPGHHIGLEPLRELAKKSVATVVPYKAPTKDSRLLRSAHKLLAGSTVVYANDRAKHINLPGTVFHPGNSTLTAHVRGEANPHLGYGRQHGRNKLWEWQFVSRIDPSAMAETISIDELSIWRDPKLAEIRESIRERMLKIASGQVYKFTNNNFQQLTSYIRSIFNALRLRFPDGAFIKPVEGSCSGDYNQIITTMSADESTIYNYASNFILEMYDILQCLKINNESIQSATMRTMLLSRNSPVVLVVHDLLFAPREVIGQAALKLAVTDRGKNFEVRVDFMQGKAIYSSMRYDVSAYYPREMQAAADFLDTFFKKANYQNQMLCGGADIGLGQDGKWHIIEFNLGAESCGLEFGTQWNLYISNFLGKDTDLIASYERVFSAPLEEQQQFLIGLEKTVLNHPEINDLMWIYIWFRDRYCKLFATNPSTNQRNIILDKLDILFSCVPTEYESYVEKLIASAKSYMDRELGSYQYTNSQRFFSQPNGSNGVRPDLSNPLAFNK